jgi:hypothetical protein
MQRDDNDNDDDYEHEHEIIIRHACEGRHPGSWYKAMLAYRLNWITWINLLWLNWIKVLCVLAPPCDAIIRLRARARNYYPSCLRRQASRVMAQGNVGLQAQLNHLNQFALIKLYWSFFVFFVPQWLCVMVYI